VAEGDAVGGGSPFAVGVRRSDARGVDAARRYRVDADAEGK
jgi:hypothetical protein